MEDRLY